MGAGAVGFEYTRATNDIVSAGNLKEKFDVIVFPDQQASTIAEGFRRGTMPVEYTGGVNNRSVAALKAYLADGGKLVFLDDSTEFAIRHLGIRARNVLAGVKNSESEEGYGKSTVTAL